MKIKIIALGRLREDYWIQAFKEYKKRLSRFANIELVEIAEERIQREDSRKEVEAALEKEWEKIERQLEGEVIELAIDGRALDSVQLSKRLEDFALMGSSTLSFVIGSSHGLSPKLKERASLRLSFSKMTFPHQMMRVILIEQIYRVFMISEGSSYHK